ncbi:MAG TPA: hypothetical protein VF816_11105 [Rhodocyclaceae bacterium]
MARMREAVDSGQRGAASFAEFALDAFAHAGEAGRRLLELQAHALVLQSVLMAAFMREWARAAFPQDAFPDSRRPPMQEDRRSQSVVIQFPDRRRRSNAG